jgi:hypothetical protein
MEVLRERGLSLSRKKSQIGCISKGFNFLGVHYLPPRREGNTTAREQMKIMVTEGFLPKQINDYLRRWAAWWAQTSGLWECEEMLNSMLQSCWEAPPPFIYVLGRKPTSLRGFSSMTPGDVA